MTVTRNRIWLKVGFTHEDLTSESGNQTIILPSAIDRSAVVDATILKVESGFNGDQPELIVRDAADEFQFMPTRGLDSVDGISFAPFPLDDTANANALDLDSNKFSADAKLPIHFVFSLNSGNLVDVSQGEVNIFIRQFRIPQ